MLLQWRSEDIGRDLLELWAVGDYATPALINTFAGDSEAACFGGALDVFTAYDAHTDDLFVVDGAGLVQYEANLALAPLDVPENREALDGAVRDLLP